MRNAVLIVAMLGVVGCNRPETSQPPTAVREIKTRVTLPAGAKAALDEAKLGFTAGIQPALTDVGRLAGMHATNDLKAMRLPAAKTLNVRLGRTSARLRSRGNAAPLWAVDTVAAVPNERMHHTSGAHHFDLGFGRRGYLEAIGTDSICVKCHGTKKDMDPAVAEWVDLVYPGDKARGFRVGDLRGWFWMEYNVPAE